MLLRHWSGRAPGIVAATTACLASLALISVPQPLAARESAAVHAGNGDLGRITGRVRLGMKPAPRALASNAYSRQISTPAGGESELTNVLVWIKDPPRAGTPATVDAELRQRDEMFVPHVIAITAGSTVSFPNDDGLFHNVFSLSRTASFDLGRYPRGDSRSRRFDKPGVVKVYCHLHSHMSAIIAVFDHPWFAKVDAAGSFTIDRVPPGRHVLIGWHERAGNTDQTVTVDAGETTRVELVVPIAAP